MPYCTCHRCEQNTDCNTVIFQEDNYVFTTDIEYMLCDLCYSMYGDMYLHHVIDVDDSVIHDTDYQEQQAVIAEEDHNPQHIVAEDEPCDDPC